MGVNVLVRKWCRISSQSSTPIISVRCNVKGFTEKAILRRSSRLTKQLDLQRHCSPYRHCPR